MLELSISGMGEGMGLEVMIEGVEGAEALVGERVAHVGDGEPSDEVFCVKDRAASGVCFEHDGVLELVYGNERDRAAHLALSLSLL